MGNVLQEGSSVRIRPLDGGGNETQVLAPAGGEFRVKGLESGSYVAVDELGNARAFQVTGGPGEEVVLEEYVSAEEVAGKELPANYGTEAPLVQDESHLIQNGLAPMQVAGDSAVLTRDGSDGVSALSPVAEVAHNPVAVEGEFVVEAEIVEDDPEFEPEVLKGEALDARAAELEIEGRSQMTADEKRAAIAEAEAQG